MPPRGSEALPSGLDYHGLLSGRLRLRQIVTALAIADHGSVAAAADMLHVAQPAVSRTLQQLESSTGIKLFERLPRGMRPTPEGELFLPHARAITTGLIELERHLDSIRNGSTGSVRIGTVVAGSADLIPLAIARFSKSRPLVKIAVVESNPDHLYASLLGGELDFVIGRLSPLSERDHVDSEPFYQASVQVLVRRDHPLARRNNLSLGDLVDLPWILPSTATALRTQIDQSFESRVGRTPHQVVECVTMPTVRRLLIETDHIAVVPTGALGSDTTSGDLLVKLGIDIAGQPVPIGAIKRSGVPLSRACEEFLETARSVGNPER